MFNISAWQIFLNQVLQLINILRFKHYQPIQQRQRSVLAYSLDDAPGYLWYYRIRYLRELFHKHRLHYRAYYRIEQRLYVGSNVIVIAYKSQAHDASLERFYPPR